MTDHMPIGSLTSACERCGAPGWEHRLPAADCRHPAAFATDHADNPSRYRCALCDTRFVDVGDGFEARPVPGSSA